MHCDFVVNYSCVCRGRLNRLATCWTRIDKNFWLPPSSPLHKPQAYPPKIARLPNYLPTRLWNQATKEGIRALSFAIRVTRTRARSAPRAGRPWQSADARDVTLFPPYETQWWTPAAASSRHTAHVARLSWRKWTCRMTPRPPLYIPLICHWLMCSHLTLRTEQDVHCTCTCTYYARFVPALKRTKSNRAARRFAGESWLIIRLEAIYRLQQ